MKLIPPIPVKNNLRFKLILSLVSIVLLTGVFSLIVGTKIINDNIIGQAYDTVQSNLTTAQFILDEQINITRINIENLSQSPEIKRFLLSKDYKSLLLKLKESHKKLKFDILNITDSDGNILIRSCSPEQISNSVKDDLFVDYVMRKTSPISGLDLMSHDDLAKEGQGLADKANIKRIPTPLAQKKTTTSEDRGLLLKSAYPVMDRDNLIGVIYGAILINRNYEIVDRIKQLVFKDEKYDGYDYGTATIFLDDVRISTNVKSRSEKRAIGTCVSEEVYNRVVKQGMIWLDKAFVVNNWYISSYKPLYNIKKKVIGILYVGILKKKFDLIKQKTLVLFFIIIIVTLIIAIIIAVFLIQTILQPVKILVDSAREVTKGNYEKKITVTARDELGELCQAFNKMIEGIVERDKKLKEQTQKQTMQAEKLASLGRLASGIAHEINNPLTGVLTFSSELRDELKDTEHKEDLDLIVNETLRCRKIVREILDFARETHLEKHKVNLNKVIQSALLILERHVAFQNITIIKQFSSNLPPVLVDENQIKSVINNLALNAADAMHTNGKLTIRTRYDHVKNAISVFFSDSGDGIPDENLSKIFDPFFTTKQPGRGTGLGLSVTYGIIQRHNGTIAVESTAGQGATFIITLPVS